MGVVCHAGFHLSESKVELDEVGVEDELDKAKIDIAGVEGEITVAGVNGSLEDEVDVEESQERITPMSCMIHSCNGLIGLEKHNETVIPDSERLCAYCME